MNKPEKEKIFIETTQEEYNKRYKKAMDKIYQTAVKGTGLDILCPTRDDLPPAEDINRQIEKRLKGNSNE